MMPSCEIELHWLTPKEGGRTTPFRGSRFTPTARFVGEQDQFSVVLDFAPSNVPNPTKGVLRLLNPDLREIQGRIHTGTKLEIMEGPRVVAQGVTGKMGGAGVNQ